MPRFLGRHAQLQCSFGEISRAKQRLPSRREISVHTKEVPPAISSRARLPAFLLFRKASRKQLHSRCCIRIVLPGESGELLCRLLKAWGALWMYAIRSMEAAEVPGLGGTSTGKCGT